MRAATPGRDRGIEAVAVESDDDTCAVRNVLQNGFNTLGVNLASRDEAAAVAPRRFNFADACAADAAQADLHHAGDMRHLARPAHRARITVAFAMHLVAPVDMGVDLQDPDWFLAGKAGQERNDDGIVAAKQDRYGRQGQSFACFRLDASPVASIVMHGGQDIAGIDAADRSAIEQRAAEVEIPVLHQRNVILACSSDGAGGRGMAAAVLAAIGASMTRPEDHGSRHAPVGEAIGKAEKGRRGGHFSGCFHCCAAARWQLGASMFLGGF